MLPSENRLRRREDFATAVRRGRRAGRPLLVAHLFTGGTGVSPETAGVPMTEPANPHGAGGNFLPARAGFVVSKAVGVAVVRNRVKRRLRHLMAERIGRLPAGSLIVVRALPSAAEAEYADLARDLDSALRKLSASLPTGAGQ
ncbi:ribonuclease P protein component [Streptacidiphilus fuscans]|uniref:Ribonuclease P protein component n=1 Tax=Streptacidiphilus fuscans TaxID=2789292 RepID=A0A931FF79_9ACTN|nr:ribonuclease P protein component [Streptacidiphilus fuscans]MBF9068164.1 ribonuclease P protein component [Streptacidiphilus fuscans]